MPGSSPQSITGVTYWSASPNNAWVYRGPPAVAKCGALNISTCVLACAAAVRTAAVWAAL